MSFSLPSLPYPLEALEPYMSRETLEHHHGKHHQAYVDNLNALLSKTEFVGLPLPDIVRKSHGTVPALFNNAGQHYNHTHFWKWMKKGGGGTSLPPSVQEGIDRDLGGYHQFRTSFISAGMGQFGSGWCWLAVKEDRFIVMSTANGESPILYNAYPILGCDVWEHSYYIDFRNRRADYLATFIDKLVDWDYVEVMHQSLGWPEGTVC